jgi:hypothetical protein
VPFTPVSDDLIPILRPLWTATIARLNVPEVKAPIGGVVEVVLEGMQNPAFPVTTNPGIDNSKQWGRLVVMPSQSVWPTQYVPGHLYQVGFVLRAEQNRINDPGFEGGLAGLEKMHRVAQSLLDGWVPTGLVGVMVVNPLAMWRQPEPMPQNDPDRSMVKMTADYRCEVIA